MSTQSVTRPDGSTYLLEMNDQVVVHGTDVEGNYLGLVEPSLAAHRATKAPPADGIWRWMPMAQRWQRVKTLDELRLDAYDLLDKASGTARLKYITDVPGQAGTYLLKDQQAKEFIAAGGLGPVPPYIQGEADATGLTVLQAAQYIASLATLWADQVGPAIERERRYAKVQVEEAFNEAGIASAVAAGLASLASF